MTHPIRGASGPHDVADSNLQIISFGGGVQTTALAILNLTSQVLSPTTQIVFADTGGEHPETYSFVASFAEWVSDHGGTFVRVSYGDLYDDYRARSLIPYRTDRRCTDKYKIRPVRRYLRSQVGRSSAARATVQLGISTDEERRAITSDVQWVSNRYPLIELGMNRADCVRVIDAAGLAVPRKSGCYYCPFQGKAAWAQLRGTQPMLFDAAVALEANAALAKPGVYLHGKAPLTDFDLIPNREFEWNEVEGECVRGYCFS